MIGVHFYTRKTNIQLVNTTVNTFFGTSPRTFSPQEGNKFHRVVLGHHGRVTPSKLRKAYFENIQLPSNIEKSLSRADLINLQRSWNSIIFERREHVLLNKYVKIITYKVVARVKQVELELEASNEKRGVIVGKRPEGYKFHDSVILVTEDIIFVLFEKAKEHPQYYVSVVSITQISLQIVVEFDKKRSTEIGLKNVRVSKKLFKTFLDVLLEAFVIPEAQPFITHIVLSAEEVATDFYCDSDPSFLDKTSAKFHFPILKSIVVYKFILNSKETFVYSITSCFSLYPLENWDSNGERAPVSTLPFKPKFLEKQKMLRIRKRVIVPHIVSTPLESKHEILYVSNSRLLVAVNYLINTGVYYDYDLLLDFLQYFIIGQWSRFIKICKSKKSFITIFKKKGKFLAGWPGFIEEEEENILFNTTQNNNIDGNEINKKNSIVYSGVKAIQRLGKFFKGEKVLPLENSVVHANISKIKVLKEGTRICMDYLILTLFFWFIGQNKVYHDFFVDFRNRIYCAGRHNYITNKLLRLVVIFNYNETLTCQGLINCCDYLNQRFGLNYKTPLPIKSNVNLEQNICHLQNFLRNELEKRKKVAGEPTRKDLEFYSFAYRIFNGQVPTLQMDATASCLQMLALELGDRKLIKATNFFNNSSKAFDPYSLEFFVIIGVDVSAYSSGYQTFINTERDLVKNVVMLRCFGASKKTILKRIRQKIDLDLLTPKIRNIVKIEKYARMLYDELDRVVFERLDNLKTCSYLGHREGGKRLTHWTDGIIDEEKIQEAKRTGKITNWKQEVFIRNTLDPEYLQFGTGNVNKIGYRRIPTVEELQDRLTVAQKELLKIDDGSVDARILDSLLKEAKELLTKKPSTLRVTDPVTKEVERIVDIVTSTEYSIQDKAKLIIAALANLSHFLDAFVCREVVCEIKRYGRPILTIHDGFLVSANDAHLVRKFYNEGLIKASAVAQNNLLIHQDSILHESAKNGENLSPFIGPPLTEKEKDAIRASLHTISFK